MDSDSARAFEDPVEATATENTDKDLPSLGPWTPTGRSTLQNLLATASTADSQSQHQPPALSMTVSNRGDSNPWNAFATASTDDDQNPTPPIFDPDPFIIVEEDSPHNAPTTSIVTGIPPQEPEHTIQNKNSDQTDQQQSPNTNNNHKHNIMASQTSKKFCWGFAFVVVCVIIGVLAASFKKVPSTEMGVQYNVHKKELDDATKSGGLFAGPPGYQFVKFPSTFITVDLNDRQCVSNDGLLVTFSVTFQYQMIEANILNAIKKYRDFDGWASVVEQAGISAIHHSCAEYFISEFQNLRGAIQNSMEDNLKLKLQGNPETGEEGVEAIVVALQLTYIGLPNEYKTAIAEKQTAEEDIALAIAERNQETTKAGTELLRAKEEARKIKDTASNEAEVLLTEARLKAQETLFSFQKEAEALVEVRNALNLTTEGVLAYLSNRLLAEAGTLKVTTGEPAKLSRSDEL